MKTLFVVGGLPFGGIENLLFDISKELLRRNFPFKVVNLSGTGQKVAEFKEAGIPLINLESSLKAIKTFRLKTALKLRRLIESERAEIVHTMQFPADYFTRIALIDDRRRKVITHIHTVRKEKRIERRIFNRVLSIRTDAFLAVSRDVHKVVEREHNLFRKPSYVFYNAVNYKKLEAQLEKPAVPDVLKGKKVFITVGRLVRLKRIDLAIRALALIEKKYPDAVLAVIGDGKERQNLERLALNLNLKDRVFFFGYQKEVAPFLSKAFALLMPSEHEGLPVSHLEAAYFGLPAVISPFVPSRELLSDASLVAGLSPEEIAKKMELLLTERELYRELSDSARKTARLYSIERYVDTLINFYGQLKEGKLPEEKVLF